MTLIRHADTYMRHDITYIEVGYIRGSLSGYVPISGLPVAINGCEAMFPSTG